MAALGWRTNRFDRESRMLASAFAASLALHAIVFAVLPIRREWPELRPHLGGPTSARLLESPPIANTVLPPMLLPSGSLAAVESLALGPEPIPAPERRRNIRPPAKPASSESASPALTADDPPNNLAAATITPSDDPPDAGTLAQYRLAVISSAQRFKQYPSIAQQGNAQGRVEIRMAIEADGSIASLVVRSSSGHVLLDQQALEMIERAKAVAIIPLALRGKQFAVEIPIEFALSEPGS